jgi:hypothetical protein
LTLVRLIFDSFQGGQRNERKKWPLVLDTADAIIFVGALSQFNEICYEDGKTNKMLECLKLAKEISENEKLINVPMYLILNKQDAFAEELRNDDISEAFPDCPKQLRKHHQSNSVFLSPRQRNRPFFDNPRVSESTKISTSKSRLGVDEISQILSFLRYTEILRLSSINSLFWEASDNDLVWREICLRYDRNLKYETVESFYEKSSCCSLWKYYFVESKKVHYMNQNYIVKMFQEATNYRFTDVYVTKSFDNSIHEVFDEIFDEICDIK